MKRTSSSFSPSQSYPLLSTPPPVLSPEEALAAQAPTCGRGRRGRAATALSRREGRSSAPPGGRAGGRGGEEERRGKRGVGRDGVRKKEEDRARSDRIGADKGFGESKRARRGGAGGRRAGRQTPNREAAACRARLDLSWARGPLTHARAGEATRLWHPTFQLQGLRGAREMQLARHAGKTRGTGRGARGSRRGMRDARRGVPGGPLSPVPCPPPAESCPTVSPAWSRSAPQSSTAPGLLPGSPDTGDSRGYPLHGGRVGSGPQPASFLARESCSSKLDFPLRPLGSFLLYPRDSLARCGPAAGAGMAGPDSRGECPTPIAFPSSPPNGRFPRGELQPTRRAPSDF